jgi:rod shape-determining protein MreB and related proteins
MGTTTIDADAGSVLGPAGHRRKAQPVGTAGRGEPAALAVDLGSGQARVWSVGDGIRAVPTADNGLRWPAPLVRRGRIVDADGCVSLLTRLVHAFPHGLAAGPVVVACRPVLATAVDQDAIRRVVTAAFAPSRILLINTVRAAAIGSGAATGVLLVVDVGAQLTEVAVLVDGRVVAARRAETGTQDRPPGGASRLLAGIVTRLVADIAGNAAMRRLTAAALGRGVVIVGDGATTPELTIRLAANLRVPVRPATSPRLAALSGAGLAAMAACRHPTATAA